jgi:hypothetical protein
MIEKICLWENRCHNIWKSANYTFEMIQIIAKLDEIFSHILNMDWLYHFNYNWKVCFMWFHKKTYGHFFIQTSISVFKKYILLKNY